MKKFPFFSFDKDKYFDAVFEGGGIRGIGYVGAARAFEEAGYRFRRVAGTSAGAIVAALLASGYSAKEMHEIMTTQMDFKTFKQSTSKLGHIGMPFKMLGELGYYSSQKFEDWLAKLLEAKGVKTFSDLKMPLKVTAADVSDIRSLVLPDDLKDFDINPDEFTVAKAVRMSMSIPVFYTPSTLKDKDGYDHDIVDGGIISNYPVWIYDNGDRHLDVPVIGFRFNTYSTKTKTKRNIFGHVGQVLATMMIAGDNARSRSNGDLQRTVYIDTKVNNVPIGITEFDISKSDVEALYQNGYHAGQQFLKTWDFKKWRKEFR